MQLEIFQWLHHDIVYTPTQKAIQAASDAQERTVNGWNDKAYAMLKRYVLTADGFLTHDFRVWAESNGLEQPREPRAYGALIVRAKKDGVIRATGIYRMMESEKSHSCPKMVWIGG